MTALAKPATEQTEAEAFEAQAKAQGHVDDKGFFSQDDWEFELDTMQDRSRTALEQHLAKAPVDHDTAMFLKGYMMDSRPHFTAFDE